MRATNCVYANSAETSARGDESLAGFCAWFPKDAGPREIRQACGGSRKTTMPDIWKAHSTPFSFPFMKKQETHRVSGRGWCRDAEWNRHARTSPHSPAAKHMHPLDRSTVRRDPAPWLSETQPPRDYLNCFAKWINGARRWSRSPLGSSPRFPLPTCNGKHIESCLMPDSDNQIG